MTPPSAERPTTHAEDGHNCTRPIQGRARVVWVQVLLPTKPAAQPMSVECKGYGGYPIPDRNRSAKSCHARSPIRTPLAVTPTPASHRRAKARTPFKRGLPASQCSGGQYGPGAASTHCKAVKFRRFQCSVHSSLRPHTRCRTRRRRVHHASPSRPIGRSGIRHSSLV